MWAKLNKLTINSKFRHILAILTLLLVMAVIYGFGDISKLGLYSDDWERIHFYTFNKAGTFNERVRILVESFPTIYYRISQAFLYPFGATIGSYIHNDILAMHIVSLFLNTFTLISLYFILNYLIKNKLVAVLASIFIYTLPGRSATFYWGSTQTQMFSNMLLMLIFVVHYYFKRFLLFSSILIFVLSASSVWSYEITLFIPIYFLISFLLNSNRKNLYHLISSGIAVLSVVFFKLFLYSSYFGLEGIKKFDQDFTSLSDIPYKYYYTFRVLFSEIGFGAIIQNWSLLVNNGLVMLVAVIIFLVSILLIVTKSSIVRNHDTNNLAIIGLIIIFGVSLSYMPVLHEGNPFSILGKQARFTTLPIMGTGFLLVYILTVFSKNKFQQINFPVLVLLGTSIILNLVSLNIERKDYIRSWEIQQDVLSRVDLTGIPKDRPVMIFVNSAYQYTELDVPVFSDFWTISYALSLKSNNALVEADFASNPLGRLDSTDGYQSEYWRKRYYNKNDIYMLDLSSKRPTAILVGDLL